MRNASKAIDPLIGAYIKKLRKKKRITQATCGSKLDVSHEQFRKYESGENKLSLTNAIKLSQILEFDMGELCEVIKKEMFRKEVVKEEVTKDRVYYPSRLSYIEKSFSEELNRNYVSEYIGKDVTYKDYKPFYRAIKKPSKEWWGEKLLNNELPINVAREIIEEVMVEQEKENTRRGTTVHSAFDFYKQQMPKSPKTSMKENPKTKPSDK